MSDVRSSSITPIAVYCVALGFLPFSLAVNIIINNMSPLSAGDGALWVSVIAAFVFSFCLFAVGIGIYYLNQMSWKILFFSLMISVACAASFLMVYSFSLWLGVNLFSNIFFNIQFSGTNWFCFLTIFLSEIMILYYLTRQEVVVCYGELGERISPFGLY